MFPLLISFFKPQNITHNDFFEYIYTRKKIDFNIVKSIILMNKNNNIL